MGRYLFIKIRDKRFRAEILMLHLCTTSPSLFLSFRLVHNLNFIFERLLHPAFHRPIHLLRGPWFQIGGCGKRVLLMCRIVSTHKFSTCSRYVGIVLVANIGRGIPVWEGFVADVQDVH